MLDELLIITLNSAHIALNLKICIFVLLPNFKQYVSPLEKYNCSFCNFFFIPQFHQIAAEASVLIMLIKNIHYNYHDFTLSVQSIINERQMPYFRCWIRSRGARRECAKSNYTLSLKCKDSVLRCEVGRNIGWLAGHGRVPHSLEGWWVDDDDAAAASH